MTKVTAQMSVSLDGFYTGPRDTMDPKSMSGWMQGPEAPGFFRVTRWVVDAMGWRERQGFAGGERSINSEIIEETFAAAIIIPALTHVTGTSAVMTARSRPGSAGGGRRPACRWPR